MKNTVLFIDAGHGGIDPIGRYTTAPSKQYKYPSGFHQDGWFYEGVSNRQIAAEFMAQASRMGFICIPVYHPYKDTSLGTRTHLANTISNELGAESLYISFHSNAYNGTARGWCIFHHPTSTKGKALCEDIAGYSIEPRLQRARQKCCFIAGVSCPDLHQHACRVA
jgi:N-acetylmuramoyl-L-alanine amidase